MRVITFWLSIILLGVSQTARAAESTPKEPAVTNEPSAAKEPSVTNEQPVVKEPPVTKEQVLAAIAMLETNAASDAGVDASNVIIRFAKESNAVKVRLTTEILPWMTSTVLQRVDVARKTLLAAYLGGNIRAQLKTQKPVDDLYEGWVLTISAYHQIRRRKPEIVVAEIDDLGAKQQKGELKLYAVEIQNKQPKP